MLKPRNDARLSPCEAFWQKHNGFLCEKPILPYEHSAKWRLFFCLFFPFYDIFNAVKVILNFNVYVAQKKKYFLCKERF